MAGSFAGVKKKESRKEEEKERKRKKIDFLIVFFGNWISITRKPRLYNRGFIIEIQFA